MFFDIVSGVAEEINNNYGLKKHNSGDNF